MNEKIELIFREIRARRYSETRELLNKLGEDLDNLQEFFDEVKKVCMEAGKTNILSKDKLENLLEEHKND